MRYSVTVKISGRMRTVKILEIDSALLENAPGNWPDGLEPIDGALVCYDQTQPSTANQVVDLLSECQVAMASMSDHVHRADAGYTTPRWCHRCWLQDRHH